MISWFGIVCLVFAILTIVFFFCYSAVLVYTQYFVKRKTLESDKTRSLPSICQAITPPIHVSHRGGGAVLGPPNTMYTFRRCIHELGTDVLEIDLHLTKDGHVVICHDRTVDLTTNGTGWIRDMTLEELKQLDAAYYYTTDAGATYSLRSQDVTIPTLEEVLDEFVNDIQLLFFLDIKQREAVAPTLSIIKERGLEDRVFLGAVPLAVNKEILRLKPDNVPVACDSVTATTILVFYYLGLLPLLRINHDIIGLHIGRTTNWLITDGLIKAIHSRNRWVAVSGPGLDVSSVQKHFIDLGVQLIISDRPDVLNVTMGRSDRQYFASDERV